ncbi:alpha/beta hydrolase [Rhodobacteraceae bacterium M382]|nr:alpha/beta hydrolase [Rhodobacteraceae bacterium M382]
MKDRDAAVPQPLFVRSFGQGPRQALALHCTIAHSGTWRGLASELGDELTLITPDFLSHGRSPDWDREGTYQDRMVAACLPFFDQKMDLIGHSFGATVALCLAVLYPERVRSLTLIEPVFFAVAIADDPICVQQHEKDAEPFTTALTNGDEALGARLFNRMWSTGDAPRWPDLPQSTRDAMIRGIHVVGASRDSIYLDLAGVLKPGVLERVTAPVQLLRGSLTHPVIDVINEGLCRRLPNARSAVVEGAGHMLPITNPRETARFVHDLLKRSA